MLYNVSIVMGRRRQKPMPAVLTAEDLPTAPTVPFFKRLNQLLEDAGFESFVEELCQPFYAQRMGRPSLPPEVYFRLLLLGFLMGLDSERRIALMACDSLSLRAFLGYGLHEKTPDHSTLSRTRRLLSLAVHEQVFSWVLERLREAGLAEGNNLTVDATTLQANAALKTLRHKQTQQGYRAFVRSLAEAAGETVESEEDLNRFDKKRKGKSLSNAEWESPTDPDARVAKMKDGSTKMAYKAEHAVDLDSGALVGITVQEADQGDTKTLPETLEAVQDAQGSSPETVVLDRGYHSDETLERIEAEGADSYVPEPKRKPRNWAGKPERQRRHEENEKRVASEAGREYSKQRTEKVERSMAHMYATGAMRRLWLRGKENVRKRLLIHACGFNLGVLMRSLTGTGTPRGLQGMPANLAKC